MTRFGLPLMAGCLMVASAWTSHAVAADAGQPDAAALAASESQLPNPSLMAPFK